MFRSVPREKMERMEHRVGILQNTSILKHQIPCLMLNDTIGSIIQLIKISPRQLHLASFAAVAIENPVGVVVAFCFVDQLAVTVHYRQVVVRVS